MSDQPNGDKIAAAQAEIARAEARLVGIERVTRENREQIETLKLRVAALEDEARGR